MNLGQIQTQLTICWAVILLVIFFVVVRNNRGHWTTSVVIRHLSFNVFVFLGILWLLHEDQMTRLIFGKEVFKGSPEEFFAGVIILGGILGCFAAAAVALGKNRKTEFGLYLNMFKRHK